MLYRFAQAVYHADRDYVVEKFGREILLRGGLYVLLAEYHAGQRAAAYLYVVLVKARFQLRQKVLSHVAVN